jgi:hypothetical protein
MVLLAWVKNAALGLTRQRELACTDEGYLITVAGSGASAPPPPLPANAATNSEQQAQTAQLVAANSRTYKAGHILLQVGDGFSLPAGTYRKVSWTLLPSDQNTPNFRETCRIAIDGNAYEWNANQSGMYGDSTVTCFSDFEVRADACLMNIVWEF